MANDMAMHVWEMLQERYFKDLVARHELKFKADDGNQPFLIPFDAAALMIKVKDFGNMLDTGANASLGMLGLLRGALAGTFWHRPNPARPSRDLPR